MKYVFLVLTIFSISACSSIRRDPEPCVCGPMKDINELHVEAIS